MLRTEPTDTPTHLTVSTRSEVAGAPSEVAAASAAPVPLVARRTLLAAGATAAGAAGIAMLAGCSKGSTNTGTSGGSTGIGSGSSGSGGSGGTASGGGSGDVAIAKVADIPVGNAIAATLSGQPILVSQPSSGTVVAFSAICTHMGCTVAPAGTEFHCPCHGSIYDAATGAVKQGPAPQPLAKIATHIVDGEVMSGA